MPKKLKTAKVPVKNKPRSRGLGFGPEEHKKRETGFINDARRFLREVEDEADAGNCATAFSRLIDGVSYAGMAEAEAQSAGADAAPIASLAASAVKYFRKTCKVGG